MSYNRRMPVTRPRSTDQHQRKTPPKLSEVGKGTNAHDRLVYKINQGMGFPNKPL